MSEFSNLVDVVSLWSEVAKSIEIPAPDTNNFHADRIRACETYVEMLNESFSLGSEGVAVPKLDKEGHDIGHLLAWLSADINVRDFALGLADHENAESVLCVLANIAGKDYLPPIGSLLAAVTYEKGDTDTARAWVEVALECDHSYSLALLLGRVFGAGWPRESFAQMRKDLHPKVCEVIFSDN